MKINPKALGLAGGAIWGGAMFVLTIFSVYTGYAAQLLGLMSTIYPGYSITLLGAPIGLVYGFIDSFVGLYLLALLYNKFNK